MASAKERAKRAVEGGKIMGDLIKQFQDIRPQTAATYLGIDVAGAVAYDALVNGGKDMAKFAKEYKKALKESGINTDLSKHANFKKGVKKSKSTTDIYLKVDQISKFESLMSTFGDKISGKNEPDLDKMSTEELLSRGYVRVPGFTRKDGTKVKSHLRKLR